MFIENVTYTPPPPPPLVTRTTRSNIDIVTAAAVAVVYFPLFCVFRNIMRAARVCGWKVNEKGCSTRITPPCAHTQVMMLYSFPFNMRIYVYMRWLCWSDGHQRVCGKRLYLDVSGSFLLL